MSLRCERCGEWFDDDRPCPQKPERRCYAEMVAVPRENLRILYDCARAFDTRIPEGNGSAWAFAFHDLFSAPTHGKARRP